MCSGPHAYATYGKFCGQAAAANIVKICSDVFKTIACSWEQRLVRWLGRAPAVSFFNRHTPCILRCVQWGGAGIERSADGTFCVRRRKFREGRICFGNNALNRIELAMICILWMTAVTPCRPKLCSGRVTATGRGLLSIAVHSPSGQSRCMTLRAKAAELRSWACALLLLSPGLFLSVLSRWRWSLTWITFQDPVRTAQ